MLHSKGVCHLDLKPENILLDKDEKRKVYCVLTDFGISQIVNNNILKVKAFDIVPVKGMSVNYAAPERFLMYRQRNNVSLEMFIPLELFCMK